MAIFEAVAMKNFSYLLEALVLFNQICQRRREEVLELMIYLFLLLIKKLI